MAIPFLNHLDLRSVSELQNAILHKTTSSSASDVEGKIIYDTGSDSLKYYNGSAWINLDGSGDISAVNTASGSGLSGGATSGAVDLQVVVDNATLEISTNTIQAKTAAIADAGTALATADQIHTFVTGYADAAGTDNSTNVTLETTSHNYLSISGQEITLGAIELGATGQDITGTLPIDHGGTGQTTAAGAADALLNVSQGGALSIGDSSDTITIAGNLTVTGDTTYKNETIQIVTDNTIAFEGATADAHEILLTAADATDSDKTITLPNATGTVALTSNISDSTITITAGAGLITGGTFTLNGGATEITIDHEDTSSQASVDGSGRTYIQDITLDTYGHVTGIGTATETVVNTDNQLATAASLIDVSAMAGNNNANVNHALGSKNLVVQLYDTTSGLMVFADVDHVDTNNVKMTFAQTGTQMVAAGIGDIRVVVIDAKNGLTDITPTYS
jgi:hypothetical protein